MVSKANPEPVIAQLFGFPNDNPPNSILPFGDIEVLAATCDTFWWHTSRNNDWVSVVRKWGQSVVMLSCGSYKEITLLGSAVRKSFLQEWCCVTIISRHKHIPSRSAAYADLLTTAKHEYGSSQQIYNELTIEELWRLWNISKVSCSGKMHHKNVKTSCALGEP